MAVYHLAKGARPLNIGEFLDPALLPTDCQVAAVVGDTLDPENGLETNGIRSYTMWGEIGAQLGREAGRCWLTPMPSGRRRARSRYRKRSGRGRL